VIEAAVAGKIYIVDDDDAVRDSLLELFDSVGLEAKGYASAQAFLDDPERSVYGVLVLDIRMPGISGLDLQRELTEEKFNLPIMFITGHGDVPMAVEAMKHGAVDFIQKPFRDQDLLDRVQNVLAEVSSSTNQSADKVKVLEALDTLTPREKEILDWIANGHPNKVIASELGISQRTVENHRARLLDKLNARSTAALIKLMMLASSAN
jgi:RNA polymerase sigma factor (sigma-70 family)